MVTVHRSVITVDTAAVDGSEIVTLAADGSGVVLTRSVKLKDAGVGDGPEAVVAAFPQVTTTVAVSSNVAQTLFVRVVSAVGSANFRAD